MGLSNYPPGVTGNEYAISGAEHEWEEEITCPFCDWTGRVHHEAHREFGVVAFCENPDAPECEGTAGIDVTEKHVFDPDEAYDRMREDELTYK